MRPKQRIYSLCPEAEKVIMDRIGLSTAGPDRPSPSLVLNAILLRYDHLMRSMEGHLLRKYNTDELDAFEAWSASLCDAHLQLSKLDQPAQTKDFRKLMERGADCAGTSVLDSSRRRILMRILSNNFQAPEMFSLADRLCLKLSRHAKKRAITKERELEGQGG